MTTASNGPSWSARANQAASVQALLPSRGSGRFCVHGGRNTRWIFTPFQISSPG